MGLHLQSLLCYIPGNFPSYICTQHSPSTLSILNCITCCLYLLCSILNGFRFILHSSERKLSPWSCFPACFVSFVHLLDMLLSPLCELGAVMPRINHFRSVLNCHVKVRGNAFWGWQQIVVGLASVWSLEPLSRPPALERWSSAVRQTDLPQWRKRPRFGPLRCGRH